MTRKGKIARLPQTVRRQLNQRLDDGELGTRLVDWLNGLPDVRMVLERDFQGKAVTEQNLSEWKQGGYQDWVRHQEVMDFARTSREEALELAEELGTMPMTDILSASVALLLAKMIRELEQRNDATPETRLELLALIREWTVIRNGDHHAARLKMRQMDWDATQAKVAAEAERVALETAKAEAYSNSPKGKLEAFEKRFKKVTSDVIKETSEIMMRQSMIDTFCGKAVQGKNNALRTLVVERIKEREEEILAEYKREWINDMVASAAIKNPESTDDEEGGGTEEADNRTESDSIRPNPTMEPGEGQRYCVLETTNTGSEQAEAIVDLSLPLNARGNTTLQRRDEG